MFIKLTNKFDKQAVLINCDEVQMIEHTTDRMSKIWFKTAETEYLVVTETIDEIISKISELQGVKNEKEL